MHEHEHTATYIRCRVLRPHFFSLSMPSVSDNDARYCLFNSFSLLNINTNMRVLSVTVFGASKQERGGGRGKGSER